MDLGKLLDAACDANEARASHLMKYHGDNYSGTNWTWQVRCTCGYATRPGLTYEQAEADSMEHWARISPLTSDKGCLNG